MSNKNKIFIIAGCCCVIAAAALYSYNIWLTSKARAASEELTGKMVSLIASSEQAQRTGADSGGTDPFLNEQSDTEAADSADDAAMPETASVSGYDVCGVLTLPALDLELAVISEWSYPALDVSACRYSGAPDGQLVILAHNYKEFFGRLNELKPDDDVHFTAVDGTVYHYVVTGTEIRSKYELDKIVSGDWDLTLFTCTYGAQNRVVVRCNLAADALS